MSTLLRSSLTLPALGLAAIAVALILLPIDRRLAMEVLLVLAMAQGWNLLCGYTGMLS
jgi:branched-chain amino acid transport system permease protein